MMYSRRIVGVVRLALLGVVLVLGGCSLIPTPYEPPSPESDQVWNFISVCQARWTYEADVYGELCQDPVVSLRRMAGDCDDFAVMIACSVQEGFHVDTFIVISRKDATTTHACAFVKASLTQQVWLSRRCNTTDYPAILYNGSTYVAADQTLCPGWTWTHPGQYVTTSEWKDLVGLPI